MRARRQARRRQLLAQDPVHGFAFGQFVDQLVQVADFSHQRIDDILDSDAADQAGDSGPRRVQPRRLREKGLEVGFRLYLGLEFALAEAGQPANDLIDFGLGPPLPFSLGDMCG